MKEIKAMGLDENDNKIIQIFVDLGMPQNFAKVLRYISQVNEWQSIDVEKVVSMRQPNVSIVMSEFEKKGWIKKSRIKKKKGKGRPIYRYTLKKPVLEIIKDFEEEKNEEIKIMKKNIEDLKIYNL